MPQSPAIHSPVQIPLSTSNCRLIRHWCDALRPIVLHRYRPRSPWHGWLPLQVDGGVLFLRLATLFGVGLDATEELLAAAGVPDVLNADVDALLDVSVADWCGSSVRCDPFRNRPVAGRWDFLPCLLFSSALASFPLCPKRMGDVLEDHADSGLCDVAVEHAVSLLGP